MILITALCLSVLSFFALSTFPTTTAVASRSSLGTNTVDEWSGTQTTGNLITIGKGSLTSQGWTIHSEINGEAKWYEDVKLETEGYGWGIQAAGSSDDIGNSDYDNGVWFPITLSEADKIKANKGDLTVSAAALYYCQTWSTHYYSLKLFFYDANGGQIGLTEQKKKVVDKSAYPLNITDYAVPSNTASIRYYVSNWGNGTARPFIGGLTCTLTDKTAPAAKNVTLDNSGITDKTNNVAIPKDTVRYIVDFDEKVSVDSYGTAKLAIGGTDANITGAGSLVTENGVSKVIYTFTLPELTKSGTLSLHSVSGLTVKDEAGNSFAYNKSSPSSGTLTFYKTMNISSALNNLTFNGKATAVYGTDYTATLTAATGYDLPSAITVKIGGTAAASTAYTYNKSTGAITIKGAQITGDIIVEANGVAKQTKVTFDRNGGSGGTGSVTATYDAEMPMINVPTLKGYTFLGYFSETNGGKQYYNGNGQSTSQCDFFTPTTLYAHWRANEYSVKYAGNTPSEASTSLSGTMANSSFTYDENETLSEVGYTLEGYTFLGWATTASGNVAYENGATVKNLSETDGDTVTLYAVWKANIYNVRYDPNKPENASGIIEGNTGTTSHRFDKISNLGVNRYSLVGWTFLGWARTDNATAAEFEDAVTIKNLSSEEGGIVKLYAVWKANTYTVSYNDNKPTDASTSISGSMSTTSFVYDKSDSLAKVGYTLKGYTFLGWAYDGDDSVTFRNGATVKNLSATDGGNVTLYAVWTTNSYTVSFETSGGNLADSVTAHFDKTLPNVTPAVRKGYNFKGYYSEINGGGTKYYNEDGTTTNVKYTIDGNTTLYALWSPVVYNIDLYSDGVYVSAIKDVTFGILRLPSAETLGLKRDNYTFIGWNIYDEQNWSMYNADTDYYAGLADYDGETVILHAAWLEKNRYTINFDANGGMSAPATMQAHEDETIVLSDARPTRGNYTFLGWATAADSANAEYLPGDEFTMGSTVVTLYAVWKLNPSLTYDPNGGKFPVVPDVLYPAAGSDVTITSLIPELEGNTFEGWSFSADATVADYRADDKITMPSSDSVLYAVWKQAQFTVTFYVADGYGITGLNSVYYYDETVEFDVTGDLPKVFVNGQRIYAGENNTYSFVLKENTHIYVADGTKLSLIYSANGGTNAPSDKNSYNADDFAEISDSQPDRIGYTFVGWATTPYAEVKDYNPGSILEFKGADVVLYAVWEANKYTVSYDPNGGSGNMTSDEFSYGTAGSLTENKFGKTGYTFVGWATSANGSVVYADVASVYNLTAETNVNITLYAVWEKTITVISFAEDGGTELNSPVSVAYGDKLVSDGLVAPARAGYFFAGYRTDKNGLGELIFDENLNVVGSGNWDKNVTELTLYPSWTPITYTVVYMNGQKELGRKSAVYGVTFTLSSYGSLGLSAGIGEHFAGWSTIPSGLVAMFKDEQVISEALTQTDGEVIYLYAVFAANEKYSVIYDANGGMDAPVDENEYYAGDKITFGSEIPKLDGYVFAGWSRNPNGNIDFPYDYENGVFTIGSAVMPEGGLTLYAVWSADPNGTLQTRIDDLKDQADLLDSSIKDIQNTLDSLGKTDTALSERLGNLSNELEAIKNTLASIEGNYVTPAALAEVKKALEDLITNTKNSLADSITDVRNELITNVADLTDLINNNSGRIDNIDTTIEKINAAIEKLNNSYAEIKQYIDGDLAKALENLIKKDNELDGKFSSLDQALETLRTEFNAAKEELNNSISDLTSRLEDAITDISNNTKNIQSNTTNIANVKETLEQFMKSYADAKAALESDLKNLAQKDSDLEAALAAEIQNLNKQLEEAQTTLNNYVNSVKKDLEDKIGDLEKTVKANTDNIAGNTKFISEINDTLDKFMASYDIAQETINSRLDALEDEDAKFAKEIERLEKLIGDAKAELNKSIEAVKNKLAQDIENLKASLEADIGQNAKDLANFKEEYLAANEVLNKTLADLDGVDKELNRRLADLEKTVDDAKSQFAEEINKLQKELDDKTKDLGDKIDNDIAGITNDFGKFKELYEAAQALQDEKLAALADKDIELEEAIKALRNSCNAADSRLRQAINTVQNNLDKAVAEIKQLISTNSDDIDKINTAIEELNNAYKAADALIDNEITSLKVGSEKLSESITALDAAYKAADDALWAAIKQVQAKLEEAQRKLEEKDNALDARINDLAAENKKLATIFMIVIIVLGVIAVVPGTVLVIGSVKKKNSKK